MDGLAATSQTITSRGITFTTNALDSTLSSVLSIPAREMNNNTLVQCVANEQYFSDQVRLTIQGKLIFFIHPRNTVVIGPVGSSASGGALASPLFAPFVIFSLLSAGDVGQFCKHTSLKASMICTGGHPALTTIKTSSTLASPLQITSYSPVNDV